MKKWVVIVSTIMIITIIMIVGSMVQMQKNMEKSDAYNAAARYISSDEINRMYGSLEKKGWFSYGRISTEGTLANMVGTAVFEYEVEDENGKRFFVQIRLTMESQTWVVTDCEITEIGLD